MTKITRRAALAAPAAVLATTAGAALDNPDAELCALAQALVATTREYAALIEITGGIGTKEENALTDRESRLLDRVADIPAQTGTGLAAKLAALHVYTGGDSFATPSDFMRSIQQDAARLFPLPGSSAYVPAPSAIERLFSELATLKRAMTEMDDDTFTEAQEQEECILDAITAHPARTAQEVVRKVQTWALVTNVAPDECREGPSPELPMPTATDIVASFLEDAARLPETPLQGIEYGRRNAPGWKERQP